MLEGSDRRKGSFWSHLIPVAVDIMFHKRFDKCGTARPRKTGHFALFWGFVGAAVTSALLIVDIYILKGEVPVALTRPVKILGNLSAVLLVIGVVMLINNRVGDQKEQTGISSSYDSFFLSVVALVVLTGCLAELFRLTLDPTIACYTYIAHLSFVMTLFVTFPYSKFAHMMYRTLAMVHARMTGEDVKG